jgi:hypothetical protein
MTSVASGFYSLTSNIALTGTFTIYAVVDWTIDSANYPLGGNIGGDQSAIALSTSAMTVTSSGGTSQSASYTGTGWQVVRVRRNASGTVFFAASGRTELSLGSVSGTINLTYLFQNKLAQMSASQYCGEMEICTADVPTVAPGTDAAMMTYLQNKWNVAAP